MSEYDDLIEGYDSGPLQDPVNDPGPLSDEENQALEESVVPADALEVAKQQALGALELQKALDAVIADEEHVIELTREDWTVHKTRETEEIDQPPHDPNDWPSPPPEVELFPDKIELRALKPDQIPAPGKHYVIFNGRPLPVIRQNYAVSEDEHVRLNIAPVGELKDIDGQRQQRADRTLRMRYRGYLCGELQGL